MRNMLIIPMLAFLSINVFALPASVEENYDLLSINNKTRADLGRVLHVEVISAKAPTIYPTNSSVGVATQLLVHEHTCTAFLTIEDHQVSSINCGCFETCEPVAHMRNVSVEFNFSTLEVGDLSTIEVTLFATDNHTGENFEVGRVNLDNYSDSFYHSNDTVVFVIDESYNSNYTMTAEVRVDDEVGNACLIQTNSEIY